MGMSPSGASQPALKACALTSVTNGGLILMFIRLNIVDCCVLLRGQEDSGN